MESAGLRSAVPHREEIPPEIPAAFAESIARLAALLGALPATAAGKTAVALFDAGPGQLGAPRLVQLALLIALARRAREAGARFAWGILQEPQAPFSPAVDGDDLCRLASARTPQEATLRQIGAWCSRLEDSEDRAELWIVGAPRLGSSLDLPGACQFQIWDPLEPGERHVGVAMRRAGERTAAEDIVLLPDDDACVRWLRAAGAAQRQAADGEPAAEESTDEEATPGDSPPQRRGEAATELRRQRSARALRSRFATVLHRLTGRTALASRLSRAVGRHHAAYLRKVRGLFTDGDPDGALLHAVAPAQVVPRRLPIRSFSPRGDLHLRPDRSRAWSAAALSADFHGELRRLYRDALHRLEGQGRIEEAAFLLAEALHADEEAVAFLERHGRLRLAAELAEARELPPGLMVRQWFLAGDRERGLQIAHRAGAFADAVTRLERSRKTAAAGELRRLWARELAKSGDYAAAVEVVWNLPEERPRARQWMDRAIELGGAPAGRMLARKVAFAPEAGAQLRAEVLNLLESWRAEGAAARLSFADEIRRGPRTPIATALARAAVRAVARDSGRFGAQWGAFELRQLLALAGDGPLRTDTLALPLPTREPWISRREPWSVEIAAGDTGGRPAHDAVFLPNGLTAVALGEAGVRLLSRGGRTVAELDQPAHRLVVSDHGDRAIAMARRGSLWRLARLDFAAQRAEPWCDARLDAFAPDYDGALWLVAGPDGLLAVDTAAAGLEGSWGVSRLPGNVLTIARSGARCSLAFSGDGHEVWTYGLPSLTLRRRESIAPPPDHRRSAALALSPEGSLAEAYGGPGRRIAVHVQGPAACEVPLPGAGRLGEPALAGDWAALPVQTPEGIVVHVIHLPSAAVVAEVALGRARRTAQRLTPSALTLADDRGRVVVLDLEHGQVRRDFRL